MCKAIHAFTPQFRNSGNIVKNKVHKAIMYVQILLASRIIRKGLYIIIRAEIMDLWRDK